MRFQLSLRPCLYLALLLISVGPSAVAGQGIERPRVPLRKAIDELRVLREGYADAFNKKDTTTVAGMYSPDAILIRTDGSVLVGRDAIAKWIGTEAPNWPQMTLTSDSLRVAGNTAWDVGTTRVKGPGGEARVTHYLAVLRRGLNYWKINSLASVPEKNTAEAGH